MMNSAFLSCIESYDSQILAISAALMNHYSERARTSTLRCACSYPEPQLAVLVKV